MSDLSFTILGCGNSTGVPAAGNYWGACDPLEPKNKRTRPSLLVKSANTTMVIDTGPDFSAQTTAHQIDHLDAVLYTHSHGDHVHGIDDLKRYLFHTDRTMMPVYTNAQTHQELIRRFYYLFEDGKVDLYKKAIDVTELDQHYGEEFTIGDIRFIPFAQGHGPGVETVGFRFGDVAYSTDIKTLDDQALQILKGVKTWIVDGAGYHQDNNPVHTNLQELYHYNKTIQAEQVILTSLSLAMDYQTMVKELSPGYKPAYDGMVL